MLHGGRDHCRNWDWTAAALRDEWHVIAPDLRGHGDSQWSPDGSYTMAGYIYDLAQLIHQQRLAPVTIIAHSLGGNIALRYAGIYPETVARLVAIEGLGPSPERLAERRERKPIADRMDDVDPRAARARRSAAAALRLHRGRLPAHAGRKPAPHRRAGAPPHRPRRQPERGRHVQLEVRQLRARVAALRHARPRHPVPVVAHRLPDAPAVRQGELERAIPPPTAAPQPFRHAQVVGIDGAGHWLHHDRLDEFLRLVREFIGDPRPRST